MQKEHFITHADQTLADWLLVDPHWRFVVYCQNLKSLEALDAGLTVGHVSVARSFGLNS